MKKKLPLIIYFSFLILYLEFIYKTSVLNNSLSINMLTVIVFSIPFILINTIITSLFKEKTNKIISIILSIFITFIYISQYIYFEFYDSIFSIYSIKEGTSQVFGEFFSAIIKMVFDNIWVTLLFLVPLILYIIFSKKVFSYQKNKKINLINSGLFIVSIAVCTLFIEFYGSGMYSIKHLYKETHAPMITINKVGLLSMEVLDLNRFMFGFEEKLYNIDKNTPKEEIPEEEVNEYNVLDIDFDKLISEETDELTISMHEYFKNVTPTKKNEYTGIFKDKNLIYITAEGFDRIAVDENLTPTLYKLVNNGFVFENYYQPLFTVSTSDGEYMYLNSLIPKEGVWSFYRSSNIYMPFALGSTFKRIGYTTNAYHNHTYSYYNRDKSHPNLGFDKYLGCGNGLEKLIDCTTWPESDVEMIESTIDDYINNDKFVAYYMTVSGHLNYTFTGNYISYKNKDLVKDLPYSDHVKAYLAANIELDKALELLLDKLESKGILDDTVIVLSPDHYPYGLKTSELNEISETDRSDKFEMFHTSLILYNSEMKKNVNVSKYVSSIDVLPTVYNLFGIEYDSRLLMGRDALSESDGLVILSDRSFINEYVSYNSITGKSTKISDDVTNEYIDNLSHEVYQRFTMSSLLLYEKNGVYLDYYRKLGLYED